MKNILILLVLFLLSEISFCQEECKYFYFINKAEIFALDSNYHTSLCYYDSAFTIGNSMPIHLRNSFYIAAKLKEYSKAKIYLDSLVSIGVNIDSYISKMANYEQFIGTKHYQSFMKSYKKSLLKAQSAFNDSLQLLLDEMINTDQKYRKSTNNLPDSVRFKKMKEIDLQNFAILTEIVKEYGWPNYRKVGKKHSGIANIILLHCARYYPLDSEEWIFFENVLKNEIKNRNFYPITLAQWIDQHLLWVEKSKQKYGSVANMDGVLFAISHIEDINNIRKEICLEPLEDYLYKKNYKLNQ